MNLRIPELTRFGEVASPSKYADVPGDHFIFISDVMGSTKAIQNGRYKEVNYVGASSIIALINAIKPKEAHYSFGGDGATFIVPPSEETRATEALIAAREAARPFGMNLRLGKVPVFEIKKCGATVQIAKFRVTDQFSQTILNGSGIALAEDWVKAGKYNLPETATDVVGDFSGLECRWQPVKSVRGFMVAVLVQSCRAVPAQVEEDYLEFIEFAQSLMPTPNPLSLSQLRLSMGPKPYLQEARLNQVSLRARFWQFVKIYSGTILVSGLWCSLTKAAGDKYKLELMAQSDYRKFDGMLRMVLDLGKNELSRLIDYLEEKSSQGRLVYGHHVSQSALITCLVFNRSEGRHFHFVDGNDGGYAMAAKQFKERFAQLRPAAAR